LTLAFIYLFIATAFQLGWLYNMKRMKKGIWKEIKRSPKAILPLILYLVFSFSNVVFLAMAMKHIPEAVAYAIWSGIVIGISAMIDQLVSKKPLKPAMIIFVLMILLGVVGLRLGTN
jgi:quaternary ammonium compound-resistance protein SugE